MGKDREESRIHGVGIPVRLFTVISGTIVERNCSNRVPLPHLSTAFDPVNILSISASTVNSTAETKDELSWELETEKS